MSLTAERITEKKALKQAKQHHKTFVENFPQLHEKNRAETIQQIVKSPVPNWGGIRVIYK